MKNFLTLGLIVSTVFSCTAFADSSYRYKQEFETFKESAQYITIIEEFISAAIEATGNVDATQKKVAVDAIASIGFVVVDQESTPALNSFIASLTTRYPIEDLDVLILKTSTPVGTLITEQIQESNDTIIIDQDFLMNATDEELEAFIRQEFERLTACAAQAKAS